MATKKTRSGTTGLRGPAGPAGPRGARGARGLTGRVGPVGALGPNADPKKLIKVLDIQVEAIYRELSTQMSRLSMVHSQLDELRTAMRRLSNSAK